MPRTIPNEYHEFAGCDNSYVTKLKMFNTICDGRNTRFECNSRYSNDTMFNIFGYSVITPELVAKLQLFTTLTGRTGATFGQCYDIVYNKGGAS